MLCRSDIRLWVLIHLRVQLTRRCIPAGRFSAEQGALQLLPEGLAAVADGPLQSDFLALNVLSSGAEPSTSAAAGPSPEESKDSQIARLRGTLAHWRAWAAGIAARYSAYNPEIVRPAKRVYIGGLPPDTSDVPSQPFRSYSDVDEHWSVEE